MYIPETGIKIVLTEDFTFSYLNVHVNYHNWDSEEVEYWRRYKIGDTITLPKDTILILRKYNIKKGKSHRNNCTFSVFKQKDTPSILANNEFNIWLQELPNMQYRLLKPDKEILDTLSRILNDELIIKTYGAKNSENYRKMESILLNGKNIQNFDTTQPIVSYFNSAVNRIMKYGKQYDVLLSIVEGEYRKIKIKNLAL